MDAARASQRQRGFAMHKLARRAGRKLGRLPRVDVLVRVCVLHATHNRGLRGKTQRLGRAFEAHR